MSIINVAIGPQDWDYYYGTWDAIGRKASRKWLESQSIHSDDMQKLLNDGIEFKYRLGREGNGDVWRTILTKFRTDEQNNYIPVELTCKIASLTSFVGTVRDAVSQLLKEVEILKNLSHPHVIHFEHFVRLYDEKSGFPHPIRVLCFMELCDGNLKQLIKWAGKLPEPLSLDWFLQIANALQYLHKSGIAHLDIKPQNILVKINPVNQNEIMVKLTDFGLSETFRPGSPVITDTEAGTHDYKAPETLISRAFDAFKTNIYSLGVSLSESLVSSDSKSPPIMLRLIETI